MQSHFYADILEIDETGKLYVHISKNFEQEHFRVTLHSMFATPPCTQHRNLLMPLCDVHTTTAAYIGKMHTYNSIKELIQVKMNKLNVV